MPKLPDDPLAAMSLPDLAMRLENRELTSLELVNIYLARIDRLDPALQAFEHVARESARAQATEIDRRRLAGEALGPLAGLPVAVKDLFVVDGMPTRGGSNLDLSGFLPESEGPIVTKLRSADAIIIGKTRTVEFAFGASGISLSRGTPWNPADASQRRIPGGSSSGSAVAVAAGLAAFALGSDTGGSVRIPAALCGVFGLKTSFGLWPTAGVLPLSPTFDTVGLITRTAIDAAFVFEVLSSAAQPPAPHLSRVRLALPGGYEPTLEPAVRDAFAAAVARLRTEGVTFGTVEMPEAAERSAVFPVVLATELMDIFGAERFTADRAHIDPVIAERMARGLQPDRTPYTEAILRHTVLKDVMIGRLKDFDGWVAPTTAIVAPAAEAFGDVERGLELTLGITCYTQPVNLFGQCAVTLALPSLSLPVGFQIAAASGQDAQLLALACEVERVLGRAAPADVTGFADREAANA
jgi:aspartyl-tRNA(Asn)/glutamyl-tRNA(Gln) amidotransferase subunit A